MALVKCPKCQGQISSRAIVCSHCGIVIEEYLENQEMLFLIEKERKKHNIICPECQGEASSGDEICPHCGFPIGDKEAVAQAEELRVKTERNEAEEQKNKSKGKQQKKQKGQASSYLMLFFSFLVAGFIAAKLDAYANPGRVLLLFIAIFVIYIWVVVSGDNRTNKELEQYVKRDTMSEVFIKARHQGFVPSIVVSDPNNRYCISVDNESKRFLVKNTLGGKYYIYQFSELVDFELNQDGTSILSGNEIDALMGGFLFGTTGAVIGASKRREVQEYCSSLYVALTVNNIGNFWVKIPLITRVTPKSSREYSFAVERAKEMIALLRLVKNNSENGNPVLPVGSEVPQVSSEAVETIKEYRELVNLGIITWEEYEQKRKELSNI